MARWRRTIGTSALLIGLAAGFVAAADKDEPVPTPIALEKLTPLNLQKTVLLDKPGKRLVLQGEVCLRDGLLEMLVCLKRTKEHEAIFSVETQAQTVHAGLMALGAEPGHPVQFQPKYQAAKGPVIEVFVSWKDENGKLQRKDAHRLVRSSVRR